MTPTKMLRTALKFFSITAGPTLAFCISGSIYAQPSGPPSTATIDALYQEAQADLEKNDYSAACPKLEQVTRRQPEKLIAHFKLGGCYQAAGKLASAWSTFSFVREKAQAAGNQQQAKMAAEKIAALVPHLATLTIVVPVQVAQTPSVEISRNGVTVETENWGRPQPVDKGTYRVAAMAPGRLPWETNIRIESDGLKISVEVGSLAQPRVIEQPRTSWTTQRSFGVAAGGVGLAGLVAGAVLGGLAVGKNDESAKFCRPDDHCSRAGADLRNQAREYGAASTAGIIVGGVLLAGGIVLFTTAPRERPSTSAPSQAWVEIHASGLVVKGVW